MNEKELVKLKEKIAKEGNIIFLMKDGFPCFILRPHYLFKMSKYKDNNLNFFHLCGYVGVSRDNVFFKKLCSDLSFKVHGGLTFEGKLFVCEDFWFFGFDCAHARDLSFLNEHDHFFDNEMETYKDVDFVKKEIFSLVEQIKNYKKGENDETNRRN